jgi:hypothetical protein
VLVWVVFILAGCGGPTTYPVKGKLDYPQGDIRLLAGSNLICQQQEKPFHQAEGTIQDDGSFELSTRWKGKTLPGAVAGSYRAWISFASENGSEERQFRKTGIHPSYLDGTSVLTFRVPTDNDVVFTLTRAPPGAERSVGQPAMGVKCGDAEDEPETAAGDKEIMRD